MPNSIKLTILSAFFLLILHSSNAQQQDDIITKRFFSVEDGLASREVFCGLQDNDGFLWFGTRNGLNRYDGKNFKLFTKQKNGLAENRIIQLAKDNNNHLFIVYGNPGVSNSAMKVEVMDLKTSKLKSLKETFPDLPFDERYVYWVANGGDRVCFLVAAPFQYWSLTENKFELKCEMKDWETPGINKEDLKTEKGAYHTTRGKKSIFFQDYAALYLENTLSFYFVTPGRIIKNKDKERRGIINITKEGKLLYSDTANFYQLNETSQLEKNPPFFSFPLSALYGTGLFRNSLTHELLMYAEGSELFLFDNKNWHTLLSAAEIKLPRISGMYGFFKDGQNNYWIFTSVGLFKIKLTKNPFVHYFTKTKLRDSSENQSRGIYADPNGSVYANCWDKLYKAQKDQSVRINANPYIKYGICNHQNNIYISGSTYLQRFNKTVDKVSDTLAISTVGEIWVIDSLSPEKILVGCSAGVFTFNTNTKQVDVVGYLSEKFPPINFTYRFINRKNKTKWLVAQNGLYVINTTGDKIIDYYGKANKRFPFDVLMDAYEDEAGIVWFATNGEGLYRWEITSNTWQQFNITAGFPSDILYRIEPDHYNNLWISSDNGLVRFNKKDFKTNTYTTSNGISHNEFNRISSFKAADGRLFFGGIDGVNAFNPKDFLSDSAITNVPMRIIAYNKFSGTDDKLVDQTMELISENQIVLQPGDRFFNLEFQLLDFNEGRLNYAYRIDGIDKDWNYINENSIRISGLPYGKYQLHIKGQAHNGQWSKNELIIPIVVLKPFYLRWWFILGIALLLIVAVIYFFRYRTKKLLKSKLALEKTVGERTEQLKNSLAEKDVLLKEIHHRVKNNLQVISSLLELQSGSIEDENAKAALTEGQNRVKSIALIHQKLYQHDNLAAIEINNFIPELYQQVASVFAKKGQEIVTHFNIPGKDIDIDTAVPLGLMLNELLTNSFKYAFDINRENILNINIQYSGDGQFVMTYYDNGPGLPAGTALNKSKSMGLRLISRLSKQIGGTATYNYMNGSTFTISFIDSANRIL